MPPQPTLRGRYERSVLSPLQWSILGVIAYVLVLSIQVDQLRYAAFHLELFDQEVLRVAPQRPAPTSRSVLHHLFYPSAPTMTPLDWPAPPVPTAWAPADEDSPS